MSSEEAEALAQQMLDEAARYRRTGTLNREKAQLAARRGQSGAVFTLAAGIYTDFADTLDRLAGALVETLPREEVPA